jgi:hypothetical protein
LDAGNEMKTEIREAMRLVAKQLNRGLVSLAALLLLAACGASDPVPATNTPAPGPTAGGTVSVETATPPPAVTQSPSPSVPGEHPFAGILGPISAPPGWSVVLCPGEGDPRLIFLCVNEGEQAIGRVEISTYPLDTLPDFQQMLTTAGLQPGAIDYKNPDHEQRIVTALQAFVEAYHRSISEDRQGAYGSTTTYTRLETSESRVSEMRGVRYGFAGINSDGSTRERWLSHAAFDGDRLYLIVAHYDPASHFSFQSDEQVLLFEPHLAKIVEGLKLPNPLLNE